MESRLGAGRCSDNYKTCKPSLQNFNEEIYIKMVALNNDTVGIEIIKLRYCKST